MSSNNPIPVANPTWYADIRKMFTPTDITHMKAHGLDLSSYDEVKNNAGNIYGQVAAGHMPPPPNAWSQAWITTFLNWMTNGFPKGTNATSALLLQASGTAILAAPSRIRKDITTLSATELSDLKKAFAGIMALPADNPNSYFVQAGYHWLPAGNLFCQHHVSGYNPWHRAYLLSFENALRSIPGCANVTLPYWDITTPFPEVLKSAPFDKYTLPRDIGEGFNAGYVTQRYPYPQIQQMLLDRGVTDDIARALSKTDWEDFHGLFAGADNDTIIEAHDDGHVSIGPTMAHPEVAAFDPVFWFFHANWDRLFWQWQKAMSATSLNGLLSTINKQTDVPSYQIFRVPVLESLAPFTTNPLKLNTLSTIDLATTLDVDYQTPPAAQAVQQLVKTQRSVLTSQAFVVHSDRVNVRVQGLNRLKIPGSFTVHLMKDGKTLASKSFFQPVEVEKCESCVKNAIVHFDFALPLSAVSGGKLGVWVEPVDQSVMGARVPNKLMGNPTVDVRLLMSTE
jgi:tyrosinase